MNAKELAAALNGVEYRQVSNRMRELAKAAKEAGLVVVYGMSDDLMEFEGAIYDELGASDGKTAYVDDEGLLPDRDSIDDDVELQRYFERKPHAVPIHAEWCAHPPYSWTFQTDIPHETFIITEKDEPDFCRGIVFALADARMPR